MPSDVEVEQCLVCKEMHAVTNGQRTRPRLWGIIGPDFLVCQRCVEAGRHARRDDEARARQDYHHAK